MPLPAPLLDESKYRTYYQLDTLMYNNRPHSTSGMFLPQQLGTNNQQKN